MEDLASVLKNSLPGALIIGFDGSATMMGHSLQEAFEREIVELPRWTRRALSNSWMNKSSAEKFRLLRKHTLPRDIQSEAISCIAELIEEGRIRAVLATDPYQSLFHNLRERLPGSIGLHRFDCATSVPNLLSELASVGGVVFLDGADRILDLGSSFVDERRNQYKIEQLKAMKEFLAEFDNVLCWGWCNLNLNLDEFWAPRRYGVKLALVGRSSDCDKTFLDTEIRTEVFCASLEDTADQPTILNLIELADHLRSPGNSSAGRRLQPDWSASDAPLAELASRRTRATLLWSEATTKFMAEKIGRGMVAIFGVEGSRVRSRLIREVYNMMPDRPRVLFYPHAELGTLLPEIEAYKATHFRKCVLAEFCDNSPIPIEEVDAYATRLCEAVRGSDFSVGLFVPVSWTERIRNRGLNHVGFAESYHAKNCLKDSNILEWMSACLKDLLAGTDPQWDGALAELAVDVSNVVQSASAPEAETVDWLHEALELWRLHMLEIERAEDLEARGPGVCKEIWGLVMKELPRVSNVRLDFDLNIKPKPKPEQEDGAEEPEIDSFDLSPKKKPRA